MNEMIPWLFIVAAYLFNRVAEWRTHSFNYRFLTFAGAQELLPQGTRWLYRLTFLPIPLALAETYFRLGAVSRQDQVLGLTLVLGGGLLRMWAIRSLGRLWTMRLLVYPHYPAVTHGPYRLLRHPEYLSRLMDGVGLALFVGSYYSAVIFAVSFGVLAFFVMRTETMFQRHFNPPSQAPSSL